jgi:phenylacetate-coenzyme A ligase PaaK-like adenylate-forming protein
MTTEYEQLVAKQRGELTSALLGHVKRTRWSADRIHNERVRGLRQLLSAAIEGSAFHRARLGDLDVESFTEADLRQLPTMSKADVMANFDDVVTDPRFTLAAVDDHIESITRDAYMLATHRAFPTGGSSGRRGVFLYGWDEWVTLLAMANRWLLVRSLRAERSEEYRSVAIFAGGATHISGAFQDFLYAGSDSTSRISASAPADEIVTYLNELQPERLMTYPSTLRMLVQRAEMGDLHVTPVEIHTSGEYLSPTLRDEVHATWGVSVFDYWGTTEGVYAFPCGVDTSMHLPDDLVIVEPVDVDGTAVAMGEPAAKILITRLYNTTQPLIRYEIADAMTVTTGICACGSAHSRLSDLRGRTSDLFAYPDGTVLTSLAVPFDPLEIDRAVIDYQVIQTERGARIIVFCAQPPDLDALHAHLIAALETAGLRSPEISITVEPQLDRLASGKLRRWVPMN